MKKLSAFLGILFIFACAAPPKKTYIVGTNAEFPPFEYLENGELKGFDIELLDLIAQDQGLDIKWVDMAFGGLIPALEAKKIDIIQASLAYTEDRAKSVLFTDPYFNDENGQMLIVKKDTPDLKGLLSELKGKKLGVAIGTKPDSLATAEGGIDITRFNSVAEGILALQADKVDAVFTDPDVTKGYLSQHPNLKAFEVEGSGSSTCIGVRHEDKELAAKLNAGIKKIRSDGTYEKLILKYINKD